MAKMTQIEHKKKKKRPYLRRVPASLFQGYQKFFYCFFTVSFCYFNIPMLGFYTQFSLSRTLHFLQNCKHPSSLQLQTSMLP
ncbi:hypothetical protein [Bartonella sp. cb54]|uniref:hypothetical protein n=1 Tax=Bartonella sp. cb54 TaxID=3385560 RepID=UPI0039A5CCB4